MVKQDYGEHGALKMLSAAGKRDLVCVYVQICKGKCRNMKL